MHSHIQSACIVLVALGAFGCVPPPDEPAAAPAPADAGKLRQLRSEAATLQADNAILRDRIEELKGRADALAERLRKLQFVNDQQKKQIEILGETVIERDEYKAEIEKLTRQVADLRKTIVELQRKLDALRPGAGEPASNPAAR